jgi:ribosomal protein S27AE
MKIRNRVRRDYISAYDKEREKRPERKKSKFLQLRVYRELHPERNRARARVNYAIRTGKLVRQPCEICGDPKSQAHHEDYSKPLEVRWLCDKHHKETHEN